MRVYATASEYADLAEAKFSGDAKLLNKRLRSASIEVESLTRFAVYAVDIDGMPALASVREAFAEATCSIVEHWEGTDDPFGVEAAAGAVKIGSVSLGTTSSSADASSDREKLARRIGDRAITILANAGLLSAAVSY